MLRDDASVKERILSLARERFLQEGFSKISVEELSRQLGISKKTFYKHFRDKGELVAGMMEGILRGVEARVAPLIAGDVPFLEKLHGVMEVLGVQVSQFAPPFLHDVRTYAPDTWTRMEAFRREIMTRNVGRLMEQGVAEGEVRQDVNRRIFLRAYLGAIDAVIRPSVLADEPYTAHEALRNIMAMFFYGILTQDASRKLRELEQSSLPHSR